MLFTPTYLLVQRLLAAKRDLELPKMLHKLDAFEMLILDDIGYVQQSAIYELDHLLCIVRCAPFDPVGQANLVQGDHHPR